MGLSYPNCAGHQLPIIRRIIDFLNLDEKVPTDYSEIIRAREPADLAGSGSRREWLNKRNEAYCRRFQLS